MRGLLNGYQGEINQISIEYLIDFSRISKISSGYTWIEADTSGLWSKSNKLEKSLETAMFRSNPTAGYQGYQLDIIRISSNFVYRI